MAVAYIVDAVRTAGGRRNGRLAGVHPVDLSAATLDAIVARTGIDPSAVEDVIMGCVSQGGQQVWPLPGSNGPNCRCRAPARRGDYQAYIALSSSQSQVKVMSISGAQMSDEPAQQSSIRNCSSAVISA